MSTRSLRFAAAVRRLGAEARSMNLVVPGFRSPPRPGERRTVRTMYARTGDPTSEVLGYTVAVDAKREPWASVVVDMVEGVLVANDLPARLHDQRRCRLLVAALGLRDQQTDD